MTARNDMEITTQDANTGIDYRAAVNDMLQFLASHSSGPSEPPETYPSQFWADTTAGIMKMRSADDTHWIDIFSLETGDPEGVATQPAGDVSSKVATTAFVGTAITNQAVTQTDTDKAYIESIIDGVVTSNTLRKEYPQVTLPGKPGYQDVRALETVGNKTKVLVHNNEYLNYYSTDNGLTWHDMPELPTAKATMYITGVTINASSVTITFSTTHTFTTSDKIYINGTDAFPELRISNSSYFADKRILWVPTSVTSNSITIPYTVPTVWTGQWTEGQYDYEGNVIVEPEPIPGTGVYLQQFTVPWTGGGNVIHSTINYTDWARIHTMGHMAFMLVRCEYSSGNWYQTDFHNESYEEIYDPDTGEYVYIYTAPHWVDMGANFSNELPPSYQPWSYTIWHYVGDKYMFSNSTGTYIVTGVDTYTPVKTLLTSAVARHSLGTVEHTISIYETGGKYVITYYNGYAGSLGATMRYDDVSSPDPVFTNWTQPSNPSPQGSVWYPMTGWGSWSGAGWKLTIPDHGFTRGEYISITGILYGTNINGTQEVLTIVDKDNIVIYRNGAAPPAWDVRDNATAKATRSDQVDQFGVMRGKLVRQSGYSGRYWLSTDWGTSWNEYRLDLNPYFTGNNKHYFSARFYQAYDSPKLMAVPVRIYYDSYGGTSDEVIATTFDGVDWVFNDIASTYYGTISYAPVYEKYIFFDDSIAKFWFASESTATAIHYQMLPLSQPELLPVYDDNIEALAAGMTKNKYYRTRTGHLMVTY